MKLVELLAKELKKWPEEITHFSCDTDGEIRGRGGNTVEHDFFPNEEVEKSERGNLQRGVIVTREMWQAERDRQKGGEWKRHRGGKQPVDSDVRVEVRHRDGEIIEFLAGQQEWVHIGSNGDVMSYRVISQPQAEEVEVKNTNMGTLSYTVDIDTSPAMQALNELSAKWDQVESPFKWRDTVNELDAYIEEFTREREALINRLALEGFALIPAMTPVMGVADISFPIEEWEIGDIVEVVSVSDQSGAPLGIFKITDIDSIDPKYELDDQYFPNHDQMKFVRRP